MCCCSLYVSNGYGPAMSVAHDLPDDRLTPDATNDAVIMRMAEISC